MLETYFSAAKMLGHLRSGPSGPYLDGFAEVLERQGYGPETAVRYLRAAAHIGHVMTEQCAGLTDIDLAAFDEHLHQEIRYTHVGWSRDAYRPGWIGWFGWRPLPADGE